jgi:hypothetical protein
LPAAILILWVVLVAAAVALLAWRVGVARGEDDTIHVLDGEATVATTQTAVARKLGQIDLWGKILTAIAAVSGILIGALYIVQTYLGRSGV